MYYLYTLFRPGVGAVVDGGDLADGQVRIALRGGESRMAQHLLNGSQVGTLLQHVRAKGVAQRVWMHIRGQAAPRGNLLDDAPDAARGESAIALEPRIKHQCLTVFFRRRQFLRARG